jgi:hypothetical protein
MKSASNQNWMDKLGRTQQITELGLNCVKKVKRKKEKKLKFVNCNLLFWEYRDKRGS